MWSEGLVGWWGMWSEGGGVHLGLLGVTESRMSRGVTSGERQTFGVTTALLVLADHPGPLNHTLFAY